MTDTRTYIRLHDGMPDHPKIDGLSDRAFRLLVESWCWCSRHLTDGFIPDKTWVKRGTPAARRELSGEGLVEPVVGGVHMHDYLEHQRSADEVAEMREKRAQAGRMGGLARSKSQASAKASASQTPKQTGSKTQASTETDTNTASNEAVNPATLRAAIDHDFEAWYAAYPRKEARGAAIRAYRAARKKSDAETLLTAIERHAPVLLAGDRQFIPNPATWLNGERWLDQPLETDQPAGPGFFEPFNPGPPPDAIEGDPEACELWLEGKRAEHYAKQAR